MFSEDHEIVMFCDMHGHSMKKNVFMYACSYLSDGFGLDDSKTNIFIRLIPFLLSKRNRLFSYENSHFRLEKFKEGTARIVNFKEFNILASYTLEASFFGPDLQGDESENSHMDESQLESLGRDLCKQLNIFISPREFRLKLQELSNYLNSSHQPLLKKRPTSARRTETMRKVEEDAELEEFDIKEAINEIPEDKFEGLCKPETKSDSGGSDLEASDNDDKKIEYILKKNKRKTKVKHEINRCSHACQSRDSSTVKFRNSSLTPDVNSNNRSKSRILAKPLKNVILKPPRKKILLKSSFCEDSSENLNQYSNFCIRNSIEKQKKLRENASVKTSRGSNGFIISSLKADSPELTTQKPMQRLTDKNFQPFHLKK